MHLTPRDIDKLLLHGAGFLAQKRLARGLRLGYPESVALIATQLLELIRDGHSVAELMDIGRRILGRRQVLAGVPELVHDVQVEGTFADGTKLVTVHDPITLDDGELKLALHGSFLPVPDAAVFTGALAPVTPLPPGQLPGHVEVLPGSIELYDGRARTTLVVTSRGDRPIQVGSHYPFVAVNAALDFDRAAAEGKHLDIPAGTAVRFEPGETRTVTLVDNASLGPGPRPLTLAPAKIARTFDRASGLLPEYDDGETK
jgi:urease subunit gamma/beta